MTPKRTLRALAIALGLVFVAAAPAMTPEPGKTFTGSTSASPYNGFKAAVGFKVATNGRQLLAFFWQDGGCIGIGGPGNAYADPFNTYRIVPIPVAADGTFSVRNSVSVNRQSGAGTKTTTSTIAGRFTNATTAVGTISYTMKLNAGAPCSGRTTFTARTR